MQPFWKSNYLNRITFILREKKKIDKLMKKLKKKEKHRKTKLKQILELLVNNYPSLLTVLGP
jgi:hypothetical protein